MVRRKFDFWTQRPPVKQLTQLPIKLLSGMRLRSYSSLATISASSTWIYSESLGWPRSLQSESVAASSLPLLTK